MNWPAQLRRASVLALVAAFAWHFQPTKPQPYVDSLVLLAVALWFWDVAATSQGNSRLPRPQRPDWLLAGSLAIAFALVWIPFYNDWRWAYTGDSVVWYAVAASAAKRGVGNLFSIRGGVDFHFTYLHSIGFNGLMFFFGTDFFWHRLGKLIATCGSIVSIFFFFRIVVGRPWALAITFCTVVNYVWIWFTYVSYGHIDSYIYYFSSLSLLALIWRDPDDARLWALCGIVAGVSLYFTQTAWTAVLYCGVVLGVLALVTRRWHPALAYGISFAIIALPVIIQWQDFLHIISSQAKSIYEREYLERIFRTILYFPFQSPYRHIGVDGAFLRPPLGELYIAGALISAIALIPILRRALRIPLAAPLLLIVMMLDVVLMTLTNNGYNVPSTKRAYNLIPTHVFLASVPAIVVLNWLSRWRWMRHTGTAIVLCGIAFYTWGNAKILWDPPHGLYGTNALDGLIELRQQHSHKKITFLTTRDDSYRDVSEGSFYHQTYRLADTISPSKSFDPSILEDGCGTDRLLCYDISRDRQVFETLQKATPVQMEPYPTRNSRTLRCFECSLPAAESATP